MKRIARIYIVTATAALFALTSCGKAIFNAQNFAPNAAPSIETFAVTNPDGTAVDTGKISTKCIYKLTVSASDPDKQTLTYTFDSRYGTFKNQTLTAAGATVPFVVGAVKAGDSVTVSVTVSDSHGAVAEQSLDIGTGKLGPSITVSAEKPDIRSTGKTNLTIISNCAGVFQIRTDKPALAPTAILSTGDVISYKAGAEKMSSLVTGPACTETGNAALPAGTAPYDVSDPVWIVFRDSLGQIDAVNCPIHIDDVAPQISSNTATAGTGSVSTDPTIDIVFNEAMDPASFSSGALTVTPTYSYEQSAGASNGTVAFRTYNAATHTASFDVTGLIRNTNYTATVSLVTDLAGNEISAALNSFAFATTPTCSVTYSGNGQTGGNVPEAANYYNGKQIAVAGQGDLVNGDKYFVCWNTSADGRGTPYAGGATFVMGTESVTLYAIWNYYYPFWMGTWSASVIGGLQGYTATQSVTTDAVNKKITLIYNNNGPGSRGPGVNQLQAWTFKMTAAKAGTVRFSWKFDGFHAFNGAYAGLKFFHGTETFVLQSYGSEWGCFSHLSTSAVEFTVAAGESYGFIVEGQNTDSDSCLNGTVVITGE